MKLYIKTNIRSDIWAVWPWEKGGWLWKHHEGSQAQITVEFEQNMRGKIEEKYEDNLKQILNDPSPHVLGFAPDLIWGACANDMCEGCQLSRDSEMSHFQQMAALSINHQNLWMTFPDFLYLWVHLQPCFWVLTHHLDMLAKPLKHSCLHSS